MFVINGIIIISTIIILWISTFFSLYKQLQMLQQNSYFPSRYYKWLKESYSPQVALLTIVFCALSSLNTIFAPVIFSLIISAVLLTVRIILFSKCKSTSIKKLVFTKRIKRLYAFAACVSVLLTALSVFGKGLLSQISFMLCIMFAVMSPLLVFLLWLITKPLEDIITKHFINDAKKILKSHPDLKVVGITGSYGKTTTKFILNRILSEKFNTVCTPQSFNTPMGVVRTVRESITPSTQVFICEMGAKKVGDIKEICDIANPDCGIITSVGLQHLDTFKTKENIYKTKFELAHCIKNNGGKTFINLDSAEIKENTDLNDDSFIAFGSDETLSCYADNITFGADGSNFDLHLFGEKINVTTKLLGRHAVCDILAAASLAYYLGVNADSIRFAVFSLKPTEHRLQLKPFYTKGIMIDDAYNANPEGSLEAVRVLGSFEKMQKIIITPGLIELGDKEYEANYNLGLEAAKYCDKIILVGQNRSKPLYEAVCSTDFKKENLFTAKSFKDALDICIPFADENTVVLLENDLPDNYLN